MVEKTRKKNRRSISDGPMSLYGYDDTASDATAAHEQAMDGYDSITMALRRSAERM
jgi:hypothetical protein